MANGQEAPYRPQDREEVAEMVRGLEGNKGRNKGKGGFSCKKATFAVQGSNISVDSWRMQDWDYKKPNLPTYARGLFTTKDDSGVREIAVRGYDKFFNHGEVRETEWPNVEANTRGPYELSVKENGCIIFMSGLADGTLLVCSKHSTGSRGDAEISHADAGVEWVEKHLASVGKTKKDLAMALRNMNATAVAELCDDDFEEHVLEYTPATAGLYLHGINLNLPEFATYPHHLVDKFAEDWGMKKTMYVIKDDIHDVKRFLERIAETGNYDGRDTEGFVIRCQSKANTGEWHDWFFKYKFEEPYLMYRQWRECTKAIISGRQPKYKKHKKVTEEYLLFASKQLHANPGLGKAYQNNHGIIKMRDDFLASQGLKGSDIIRQEQEEGEVSNDAVTRDVVLVPTATIGCGKTTVALALCHLFGWGHIQNDNITVRKGKPLAFAMACTSGLLEHPVMIADRNNHQRRERKQLIEDASKVIPNVRFVCLHYVHERSNYHDIRQATRSRVFNRGDNHQTIHASKGEDEISSIMEGFMHRFEPVDPETSPDDGFDTIIDLDPCAASRDNLETVVSKLYTEYPKLFGNREMPSAEDMDAAIQEALNEYTVDIKHEIQSRDDHRNKNKKPQQTNLSSRPNGNAKQKERKIEYFAVQVPRTQVTNVLESTFHSSPAATAKMYNTLKSQRRVQNEFHVTLIHRSSSGGEHASYWEELCQAYAKACDPTPDRPYVMPEAKMGVCKVRLERLVWTDRLMAFVVRLASAEGSSGDPWKTVNPVAHITVGTANPNIKPVESNDLLAKWLQEGTEDNGISDLAVQGDMELEGTVRGILQRL